MELLNIRMLGFQQTLNKKVNFIICFIFYFTKLEKWNRTYM